MRAPGSLEDLGGDVQSDCVGHLTELTGSATAISLRWKEQSRPP